MRISNPLNAVYTAHNIHNILRKHCVVYSSELTCYYPLLERICVLPKGKTHKTEERKMNEKLARQIEEMKKQTIGV